MNPEDFDTLAGNAMKDACGLTNPREPSHQEVVALFKQVPVAWVRGKLL